VARMIDFATGGANLPGRRGTIASSGRERTANGVDFLRQTEGKEGKLGGEEKKPRTTNNGRAGKGG